MKAPISIRSKALQTKIWGSPLTAKDKEALKKIHSLPKKQVQMLCDAMKQLFIDIGISSKDGKLIDRKKLTAFRKMLAEQRKQRNLAQKSSGQ